MQGRLISVEGLDGTGKTTVCAALAERLADAGIAVERHREPGGTALGERIRALLADPAAQIAPRAELLLFAAARAQLVSEAIAPALAAGHWVLLDRFTDSTLAYQGAGRGLGDAAARGANELATAGLLPDRTLLLVAGDDVRAERLGGRDGDRDRLERAGAELFARTGARYRELAASEPERIRVVDAAGTPEQVAARAWDELHDLLAGVAAR